MVRGIPNVSPGLLRIAFLFLSWGNAAVLFSSEPARSDLPTPIEYGPPKQIGTLTNKDIDESSGVAVSWRTPNVFWTHNDSGDDANLYAFKASGEHLKTLRLRNVEPRDWEDMASFVQKGTSYLLIADTGDNQAQRRNCSLHIFKEPAINSRRVEDSRTIRFRYEDGPRDCEAVAVDATTCVVLLATKSFGFSVCDIYQLPLFPENEREEQVAKKIRFIRLPFATAMDVSSDGHRLLIGTYANAFEFFRRDGETWQQAFARNPREIELPKRVQGEAACFGRDGKTIFLTSEKTPTPLWQISPVATKETDKKVSSTPMGAHDQ